MRCSVEICICAVLRERNGKKVRAFRILDLMTILPPRTRSGKLTAGLFAAWLGLLAVSPASAELLLPTVSSEERMQVIATPERVYAYRNNLLGVSDDGRQWRWRQVESPWLDPPAQFLAVDNGRAVMLRSYKHVPEGTWSGDLFLVAPETARAELLISRMPLPFRWDRLERTAAGWLLLGSTWEGETRRIVRFAEKLTGPWTTIRDDDLLNSTRSLSGGPGGHYLVDTPETPLLFSADGGRTWSSGPTVPGMEACADEGCWLSLVGNARALIVARLTTAGLQLWTTTDGVTFSAIEPFWNETNRWGLWRNLAAGDERFVGLIYPNFQNRGQYLWESTDGLHWSITFISKDELPIRGSDRTYWSERMLPWRDQLYLLGIPSALIREPDGADGFRWRYLSVWRTAQPLMRDDRIALGHGPAFSLGRLAEGAFLLSADTAASDRYVGYEAFRWRDGYGSVARRREDGAFVLITSDDAVTWTEQSVVSVAEPGSVAVAAPWLYVANEADDRHILRTREGHTWEVLALPVGDRARASPLLLATTEHLLVRSGGEAFVRRHDDPAWLTFDLPGPFTPWHHQREIALGPDHLWYADGATVWSIPREGDGAWTASTWSGARTISLQMVGGNAYAIVNRKHVAQRLASGRWQWIAPEDGWGSVYGLFGDGERLYGLDTTGLKRLPAEPAVDTWSDTAIPMGEGWFRDGFAEIVYQRPGDGEWTWLAHREARHPFGWVWFDRNQLLDNAWLWDPQLGWIHLTGVRWPEIYVWDQQRFLRFDKRFSGSRQFYIPGTREPVRIPQP